MAIGTRSPLAGWMGGAGNGPANNIGIRSMQVFWMGGAGSPPSSAIGTRGMLSFWMGGAANGGGSPPDPGIVDWIIRARRHCIR